MSKKKMSFVATLKKAIYNCWETAPHYNKNAQIVFKRLGKGKGNYSLSLHNIYGNGFNYTANAIRMNVGIMMHVVPAKSKSESPKMVFMMPKLYHSLAEIFLSYHLEQVMNPIAFATSLSAFLSDKVSDLNNGRHQLPGHHHPIKFHTDCDKFQMTVNKRQVSVKPLSGQKSFDFGSECLLNRGYVINSICEIINFEAYLYYAVKEYYATQRKLADFSKKLNR